MGNMSCFAVCLSISVEVAINSIEILGKLTLSLEAVFISVYMVNMICSLLCTVYARKNICLPVSFMHNTNKITFILSVSRRFIPGPAREFQYCDGFRG